MNLSVNGDSKGVILDYQSIPTRVSNFKSLTFKPLRRDSIEKTFPSLNRSEFRKVSDKLNEKSLNEASRIRSNTKDDLDKPNISPLPTKPLDLSFNSPKTHIAFSTNNYISINEIEKTLDDRCKKIREKELKNNQFINSCKSKFYLEVVMKWSNDKSLRHEEFVRNLELTKKKIKKKYLPMSPNEARNDDDDDFSYLFTTKIGSKRKMYSKLIDVPEQPHYAGASGYMSMQSQQKYVFFSPSPKNNLNDSLIEAFRVKSSLAKRKIKCNLNNLVEKFIDLTDVGLPKGGERLLLKK